MHSVRVSSLPIITYLTKHTPTPIQVWNVRQVDIATKFVPTIQDSTFTAKSQRDISTLDCRLCLPPYHCPAAVNGPKAASVAPQPPCRAQTMRAVSAAGVEGES